MKKGKLTTKTVKIMNPTMIFFTSESLKIS